MSKSKVARESIRVNTFVMTRVMTTHYHAFRIARCATRLSRASFAFSFSNSSLSLALAALAALFAARLASSSPSLGDAEIRPTQSGTRESWVSKHGPMRGVSSVAESRLFTRRQLVYLAYHLWRLQNPDKCLDCWQFCSRVQCYI